MRETGGRWLAGLGLTLLAVAVLGYHPYAEDGALYLAEVKRLLDPGLYPSQAAFVSGHLGAGLFGALVVALVRGTGVSLTVIVLWLHVLSVWGLLLGAWSVARHCYPSAEARAGAVGLLGLAMGMPVAGTSLMLMDPYLTARSLVTALTVAGLAGVLAYRGEGGRWRLVWAAGAVGLAVLLHPLMGGFGLGAVLVLGCLTDARRAVRLWGLVAIGLVTVAGAAWIQGVAAAEPSGYLRVALTRYYWFLERWQWYEVLGLVGPLAILGWAAWRGRWAQRAVARMSVFVGLLGIAIAGVFAREAAATHAVARLQPLRCFLVVYAVLLVMVGAWLGKHVLRRSLWRWAVAGTALAVGMVTVQRQTFPASDPLELPGLAPRNQWEQAFLWVRDHTPKDALFALDADYVHRAGEDAQGFRAVAERSALPDYSKDGGQASIRPALTAQWLAGERVQARLSDETDAERLAALRGTGVSWVVLERKADVAFDCPYRNATVIVCRLPEETSEGAAGSATGPK